MDSGSLFQIILMIIVFFLTLYGVVRAAVISGMKEYESEKAFRKRQAQMESQKFDN